MIKTHIRRFFGLLLLVGIAPNALSEGDPALSEVLAPVDESEKVPELKDFLKHLRVAVAERDVNFIQSALAHDVNFGFGPNESGVESVAASLADPQDELWDRLKSSTAYGGTFIGGHESGTFCMPYFYSAFPEHLDPLEHQVVVKTPVEARSGPKMSSTPVSLPEYAIVRTDSGSPVVVKDCRGRQWARIHVNEDKAYVPAVAIRSPIGSRTCLEKREGRWRITAVVKGD